MSDRGIQHEATNLQRGSWHALLEKTDGTVFVEYAIVLAITAALASTILLAVGLIQIPGHSLQRAALFQPYP